jgi:antitoxin HigA-1
MQRKPTTPGEILNEEFLKPLGITERELAEYIGSNYKIVNEIVQERARITPEIAKKFAKYFKMSPDFWLNAQRAVDQFLARRTD